MVKNESITINDREYLITYVYPGEWIKEAPHKVKNMVRINHIVIGDFTETDVENYFEIDKSELIEKIKTHINSHLKDFEDIDVTYAFKSVGYNIDPKGGIKLVISMFASLDTKLKNN